MQKRIVIPNHHGENLVGILHETGSKELVIVCHGIKSTKDRIPMVSLAVALENIEISAFRFDFAGNGKKKGYPFHPSSLVPSRVSLENRESEGLFRYGNYHREVEDLHAVIQHFRGIGRAINTIVGHSKGGNAVLLYASIYHDVREVVNISGRFDLTKGIEGRLGNDFLTRIKRDGYIDVYSRNGKFQYRVSEESLMDRLSTNMRVACQLIQNNCRVLTMHGSEDQVVPVTDAQEFDKLIANHVLRIIQGADHEFTSHQDELTTSVIDFVRKSHDQATSRL